MADYYVDATSGDDAKDGLSEANAWKTIAKVNSSSFSAGDNVYFKRGETWREQLTASSDGASANHITFGTYGTGADPIFNGADVLTNATYKWTASALGTNEYYVSLASNANFLSLPGESGDYASAPDASPLDITGDIDIQAYVALDDWNSPADFNYIVAKWANTGNQRSYALLVTTGGGIRFQWSTNGTAVTQRNAVSHGIADGTKQWIRVTLDVDAGATDNDCKFYLGGSGPTPTWVQLGPTQNNAGTTSIFNGSSPLMVSGRDLGTLNRMTGKAYRVIVKSGIDGTTEFDADFSAETAGTTSFTEDSTNAATVTINQSGSPQAEIVASADPTLAEPAQIFLDDVRGVIGTVGSLADHEWDWGDNDTLGYSTIYVRDNSGDPDTSGVAIEASQRTYCVRSNAKSYLTFQDLDTRRANDRNHYHNASNSVAASGNGNIYLIGGASRDAFGIGIRFDSVEAIIVRGMEITGSVSDGLLIFGSAANPSHDGLIEDNTVHTNLTATTNQFSAGIKMNTGGENGVKDLVVQDNVCYSNGNSSNGFGSGIWMDGPGDSNIVRRNHCYNNERHGLEVENSVHAATSGPIISYNLCHGNGATGVSCSSAVANGVNDYQVYNNTCYGNDKGIVIVGDGVTASSVTNNTVRNNIMVGNTTYELNAQRGGENDGTFGSGNIYTHNCLGIEATDFVLWGTGVTYSTYDTWEAAYGSTTSSVEADPLLANAGGTTPSDYRVSAASPCINAGLDVGLTHDYFGSPVTAAPDVGFAELVSARLLVRKIIFVDFFRTIVRLLMVKRYSDG